MLFDFKGELNDVVYYCHDVNKSHFLSYNCSKDEFHNVQSCYLHLYTNQEKTRQKQPVFKDKRSASIETFLAVRAILEIF